MGDVVKKESFIGCWRESHLSNLSEKQCKISRKKSIKRASMWIIFPSPIHKTQKGLTFTDGLIWSNKNI